MEGGSAMNIDHFSMKSFFGITVCLVLALTLLP